MEPSKGNNVQIVIAVIGFVGVVILALATYYGAGRSSELIIRATQTAEAKLELMKAVTTVQSGTPDFFQTITPTDATIPISSTGTFQTNLYVCPYDYYDGFGSLDCFTPAHEVDGTSDIDIHGSVVDTNSKWMALFVVLEPCLNCKIPKYIELETATYSSTMCSLELYTDPNKISIYNQVIHTQDLEVQDKVKISIESYITQGIGAFMIGTNPAGCDLRVRSVKIE